MKTLLRLLAVLIPLAVTPALASAQKLEAGKWTGTVVDPGGSRVDVTYDISLKADTIEIAVSAGEHGTFKFNDVKLVDKLLTFWFQPGPRVECKLNRADDGSFAGTCTDPNGGVAQMAMSPPKKG